MTGPGTTFADDRPPTDEAHAISGGAWPNLKGTMPVVGVGVTSFHDREMVMPLSTLDPALRARPSYLGQTDDAAPDVKTITYKNVPTITSGAGSDYNSVSLGNSSSSVHPTFGSLAYRTLSWYGSRRFIQQLVDPQASRAPGYMDNNWPQYMRPNSTLYDDRPGTDPSQAVAGASWPTLKGIHTLPGIGQHSYHDRETAQPLSALDPMVRARPTYLGQTEPATTDVKTIAYKNVATISSGPGSSGSNSKPELRRVLPPPPPNEFMTRPDLAGGGFQYHAWQSDVGDGLAADPQASRAPGYKGDVWPQYMRPNSTWDDDRPGSDPSLAVGGGSWPTLKGMIPMPGIGNISFHDRETTQPLTSLDPMVRARPTYRGQVEPNTTDVNTITYKNVATLSSGPGSSGTNSKPAMRRTFPPPPPNDYMTRPDLEGPLHYMNDHGPWVYDHGPGRYTGVGDGLEVDPQASRAPDYSANNWPQYMRPDSTWGDAPDPSLVLDCQESVHPGYEQQNAQYVTRGHGSRCQGFPRAVDPTSRPATDEWGAVHGWDSNVGDMTTHNPAFSRASQTLTDTGSQFGWQRTWDPRGQRVMDDAPTGVVSDVQGSNTNPASRPPSVDWNFSR